MTDSWLPQILVVHGNGKQSSDDSDDSCKKRYNFIGLRDPRYTCGGYAGPSGDIGYAFCISGHGTSSLVSVAVAAFDRAVKCTDSNCDKSSGKRERYKIG